ncbi:MAG: patatin-like protein [Proteobacteria bacterium]|nr:patatin-like protein [Pseudomonadota bacterium]
MAAPWGGGRLKEKELRFALVCYGGVSLAVYMHGITKEILKLVRASRDFHTYTNKGDASVAHADVAQPRKDPVDTEAVYFELLRQIGKTLDLRIVVDIIAGASAGGINGVILARALAHDLEIDPLRDFWLKHSDVAELMPDHVKAGPWRKWYFRPFVWMFLWKFREDLGENAELKAKLSMFLRSRWFKPPFDGYNLTKVLFDGFGAMGDPHEPGSSLIPSGLQLDLFVTVTDFRGYVTDTPIHNPPVIRDREHRQVLRYSYRHWPRGHETSSFDRDGLPALVFGARATSSFPGAFPPMQLREIDTLITERGVSWNSRVDFLYRNFRPYFLANLNPGEAAFIDGSVLNNKPFAQAIESIRGRPAYRHVDRRLLYVDPHPETTKDRSSMHVPGFFTTLKGALSDIPRNEPIHDDLAWVNTYNAEVRRLQMVVDGARSHIRAIAEAIAGEELDPNITGEEIGRFRELANNRARAETGFAYEGYLRLKLTAVIEDVAAMVAEVCGYGRDTTEASRIIIIIERWATLTGVFPSPEALKKPSAPGEPPAWVQFLLRFDVRYRQRRVRFVVRAVNHLYMRLSDPALEGLKADRLDYVKAGLYDALALLQPMTARAAAVDGKHGLSRRTAEAVKAVVRDIVKAMDTDPLLAVNSTAVAQKFESRITETLASLADEMALEADNARTDALLATLVRGAGAIPALPAAAARELIEHYVGFAVWDVLTFSITNWRDLDEFDEIRVDRLSPDDSQTLRKGDASATLKGIQFHHFGAFFCLAYRQNDYLWGRLHAAERLIDIVLDAAKIEGAGDDIDAVALKASAFEAVLRAEAKVLSECGDLISTLSADVAKLRQKA